MFSLAVNKPLISKSMDELLDTGSFTKVMFRAATLSTGISFGKDCNKALIFKIPSLILFDTEFSTADAISSLKASNSLENGQRTLVNFSVNKIHEGHRMWLQEKFFFFFFL